MNTDVSDPPVIKRTEFLSFENFDNNIRFYLAYDHLQLKDIAILFKGVDDLYELVYRALNEERVPENLKLVLEAAHTGNSIEWVTELLEKAAPPKKALRTLYLTAALIYFPVTIQHTQADTDRANADKTRIEATIQKLEAEKELIEVQKEREEAEKKKAEKEAEKLDVEIQIQKAKLEKIELENFLLKNRIKEESINKILQDKNWKKVTKKRNQILDTINKGPIYYCKINDFELLKR
jgi:hypothetical protein